jgi:hypothetical protein
LSRLSAPGRTRTHDPLLRSKVGANAVLTWGFAAPSRAKHAHLSAQPSGVGEPHGRALRPLPAIGDWPRLTANHNPPYDRPGDRGSRNATGPVPSAVGFVPNRSAVLNSPGVGGT